MSSTDTATEPKRNPRGGAPRANVNARKHGHHARKLKLTDVRLVDISQQNGPGRLIAAKAEAIMADRGGRENQTELQRDTMDRYLVNEILRQSMAHWVLQQPSLVNKRKRAALPAIKEYIALTELSQKLAAAIGLERVEPPAPTLAEFLAQRKAQSEQIPESKAEPAASGQAQPDGQEPLPERPRDVVNGRFVGAEAEQVVDDGATETA